MQVVLTQDYPQLGQRGSVVNVKPGYFRNFLFPQGLCRIAAEEDVTAYKKMMEEQEAKRQEMMAQAASVVLDLDGQTVVIKAKAAESGSLYANVHESDIAHTINTRFETHITAKDVKLTEQIKKVGPHQVVIEISAEHKATLTVVVEPSDE